MGNRIIKESILYSLKLSRLSWFEQVMFDHLIVTVDDYGISFADPLRVSRMLFPANANITTKMVREGLDHLEEQNLIFRYTVRGEEFLKLVSWEKHQRLRSSRRKFPAPEEADGSPVSESISVDKSVRKPAAKRAHTTESASKPEHAQNAEPEPATEPAESPVAELPLNDGTVYAVTREEAEEYASLYPAADVLQELRNMRGWCLANPAKRKTRSGIRSFITRWLSRVQDRGGTFQKPSESNDPYPDYDPFAELREGIAQMKAQDNAETA